MPTLDTTTAKLIAATRHADPIVRAKALQALESRYRSKCPHVLGCDYRDWLVQNLGLPVRGAQFSRYIRLLRLPVAIQHLLSAGRISMNMALKVTSMPSAGQHMIACRVSGGESPRIVLADYRAAKRPMAREYIEHEDESPTDHYIMLLDFVAETLSGMEECADEIVGAAGRQANAVDILDQLSRFARQMRDRERRWQNTARRRGT